MGISQHIHGTDNARCLISLALMTGQIGREGTGLHPLRGQNNVQGASDVGLIPMMLPDYQRVVDPVARASFEKLWNSKLDPEPGLTVVEIMHAIHDDKIHGMYIEGENPAMSDPNLNHARKALAKLDHLVVQGIFLPKQRVLPMLSYRPLLSRKKRAPCSWLFVIMKQLQTWSLTKPWIPSLKFLNLSIVLSE